MYCSRINIKDCSEIFLCCRICIIAYVWRSLCGRDASRSVAEFLLHRELPILRQSGKQISFHIAFFFLCSCLRKSVSLRWGKYDDNEGFSNSMKDLLIETRGFRQFRSDFVYISCEIIEFFTYFGLSSEVTNVFDIRHSKKLYSLIRTLSLWYLYLIV